MARYLVNHLTDVWAAEYDPIADSEETRRKRHILSVYRPHTFAPRVPVALRGPKWGTR